MSGPSQGAIAAAGAQIQIRYGGLASPKGLRDAERALGAAHNPALGLDRSVCLRDIVERVAHYANVVDQDAVSRTAITLSKMANLLEREFGGGS